MYCAFNRIYWRELFRLKRKDRCIICGKNIETLQDENECQLDNGKRGFMCEKCFIK